MQKKAELKPGGVTLLGAKIGIFATIGMALFGLVFWFVVAQETSSSEGPLLLLQSLFFLIFFAVCLGIVWSNVRVLRAGAKAAPDSLLEFDFQTDEKNGTATGDFAERLRRLEGLKGDSLISEAEYQQKRDAILRENW